MLGISAVLNYKLLDKTNKKVSEVKQMIYIYDTMYGGDPGEEISDTVALIARAAILDKTGTYSSKDFYEQRYQVEQDIFESIKVALKEFYITTTSFVMVNLEFDNKYQSAIAEISAEQQKIIEKENLLEGEKLIAKMNKNLTMIDSTIRIEKVG